MVAFISIPGTHIYLNNNIYYHVKLHSYLSRPSIWTVMTGPGYAY